MKCARPWISAVTTPSRRVCVCVSPWNFPLAIYLGQIAAALVSGNCVLAKPAEQTSLIAARALELIFAPPPYRGQPRHRLFEDAPALWAPFDLRPECNGVRVRTRAHRRVGRDHRIEHAAASWM